MKATQCAKFTKPIWIPTKRRKRDEKIAIYGTMITLQTHIGKIGCGGLCNSNGNFYLFSLVVIALIQLNSQSNMWILRSSSSFNAFLTVNVNYMRCCLMDTFIENIVKTIERFHHSISIKSINVPLKPLNAHWTDLVFNFQFVYNLNSSREKISSNFDVPFFFHCFLFHGKTFQLNFEIFPTFELVQEQIFRAEYGTVMYVRVR